MIGEEKDGKSLEWCSTKAASTPARNAKTGQKQASKLTPSALQTPGFSPPAPALVEKTPAPGKTSATVENFKLQ